MNAAGSAFEVIDYLSLTRVENGVPASQPTCWTGNDILVIDADFFVYADVGSHQLAP